MLPKRMSITHHSILVVHIRSHVNQIGGNLWKTLTQCSTQCRHALSHQKISMMSIAFFVAYIIESVKVCYSFLVQSGDHFVAAFNACDVQQRTTLPSNI